MEDQPPARKEMKLASIRHRSIFYNKGFVVKHECSCDDMLPVQIPKAVRVVMAIVVMFAALHLRDYPN